MPETIDGCSQAAPQSRTLVLVFELVGIRRGLDGEYDANVMMGDVDRSAERRENPRKY